MTVERLNDLYYLRKEAERLEEKILSLEESADIHSPDTSGKPRNPSPSNKLDEIVPKIIDLENERKKVLLEIEEIEMFIRSVNRRDQLIIRYRYEDRLSWQEIADKLGERVTADGGRQAHYRCLKNSLQK